MGRGLAGGQSGRARRLNLPARDALDSGTEDLAEISRRVQRQRHDNGPERIGIDAEEGQSVIDVDEEDKRRKSTEQVGIDHHDPAHRSPRDGLKESNPESYRQARRHHNNRQNNRSAETGQQQRPDPRQQGSIEESVDEAIHQAGFPMRSKRLATMTIGRRMTRYPMDANV